MRDLIGTCLRVVGVDVLTAADGTDAVALAREAKPEAVVLDVMMPVLDGLEVCRRLRAHPETRDATVVLCSAADEREIDWRGAGADGFLEKPFELRDVTRSILLARARRA